jgi:membrane-bound lytic murein transglycosylase B
LYEGIDLMLRILTLTLALSAPTLGLAAPCGNTSAGFEAWKADFAKQAKKSGVKK